MFQAANAGQPVDLTEFAAPLTRAPATTDIWVKAAEDCVLERLKNIRIFGGLPKHKVPLSDQERIARLKTLLAYWADGCPCVIDEVLFADILDRHVSNKARRGSDS